MNMKRRIVLALCSVGFAISVSSFAETDISPAPTLQPSPPPQMQSMQGVGQMADMESMKRMADMCQQMMQKEKAAMPFIIGSSVIVGVLLLIALVLLVVLEIQWIIYWKRLLREPNRRNITQE